MRCRIRSRLSDFLLDALVLDAEEGNETFLEEGNETFLEVSNHFEGKVLRIHRYLEV